IKGLSQWNLLLLEYPPEMRSTVSWSDLISNNRAEHIQVENFRALKTKGAGSSTNYLVNEEHGLSHLYFFKRELNHLVGSPVEAAWKSVLDLVEATEENPVVIEILRGLRDDPEVFNLISDYKYNPPEITKRVVIPLDSEDPLLPQIRSYLEAVGTEAQKKSTQDDLLDYAGYNDGEEVNVSRRNVATSVVAELLGVGHLSAYSRSAVIHDANTGELIRGNLMERALGHEIEDLIASGDIAGKSHTLGLFAPSPAGEDGQTEPAYLNGMDAVTMKFMLQTNSLQILDALCAQQDRHLGNAFYQTDEEGRLSGIQAIDNDASFGLNTDITISYSGSGTGFRTIATRYDETSDKVSLNLSYVDYDLAQAIIQLSPSVARFSLMGLIEEREVEAFLNRLSQIKELLSEALGNFESKKAADEELDPSKGDVIFLKESELDESNLAMKEKMFRDMTISHLTASFYINKIGNQFINSQKSIFNAVMTNINQDLWDEIKSSYGIDSSNFSLKHRLKYAQ
ncbi:MAG: hypothetical protein GX025_07455, partial [Clostridiales bacterium]|nr:hypothetical protein [Clostridiales bacterium]